MAGKPLPYYLDRYHRGEITREELQVLQDLLRQPGVDDELNRAMEASWEEWKESELAFPAVAERIKQAIANAAAGNVSQPPVHRVHFLHKRWFRYAAAAVLVIGIATIAIVVSSDRRSKPEKDMVSLVPSDIPPGGNKAILTLADGSTIVLDSASNGSIARQGNVDIVKTASGEIVYMEKGKALSEAAMNTIHTPKGGQYKLQLPDGTQVWLNAASSITYPTAFVGVDRKVTITGEVYFEVAKDKTKPFKVNVDNRSEVEVLGTHFNINAYADEVSIKTTLLEGSVKVSNDIDSKTIKPGEQAAAMLHSPLTIHHSPDLDQVMAWKNGVFNFSHVPLQQVMKQLERWYDVEVVYEKGVPDIKLGGEMKRDLNLSQVLKGLGKMGVHFNLEGKKLVISP